MAVGNRRALLRKTLSLRAVDYPELLASAEVQTWVRPGAECLADDHGRQRAQATQFQVNTHRRPRSAGKQSAGLRGRRFVRGSRLPLPAARTSDRLDPGETVQLSTLGCGHCELGRRRHQQRRKEKRPAEAGRLAGSSPAGYGLKCTRLGRGASTEEQ